MFKFLAKGLLRDTSRSFFPILVIATGVMLTVILHSWLQGFAMMTIRENARFRTGHLKIVTKAYEQMMDQSPLDMSLLNTEELIGHLKEEYPDLIWLPRIHFGGLLDIPDEKGETKAQGEIMGLAINLLSSQQEIRLLDLQEAVLNGSLPRKQNEILISQEVAEKMNIKIRDSVTIISSTMFGSLTMYNFQVAGTVRFGVQAMDRGAVIIDISAARQMLDMENAANEILGFLPAYQEELTYRISAGFNAEFGDEKDEFAPVMLPLREQENLDVLLSIMDERMGMMIFMFVFIMSLVLWNAGLMNGIRRYGEIGVRLAMGENKKHIYSMMIVEAVLIGAAGTLIGTVIGLSISYLLQLYGFDMSSLMKDATMIMSSKMSAQITSATYFIGILPGVLASVLGAVFSGVGIFKRQTAQLFKELEV